MSERIYPRPRTRPGYTPLRVAEIEQLRNAGHVEKLERGALRTLVGRLIATMDVVCHLAVKQAAMPDEKEAQ